MEKTMSAQKQKIAKNLKALGLGEFNGIKTNGVYTIGSVSFKALKEIEEYIKGVKGVKEGKGQAVSEPVASKVEAIAKVTEIRGRFADTVHYTVAVFSPEKGYTFLGKDKDIETYDQALALVPGIRVTTSDAEFAQWLTEMTEKEAVTESSASNKVQKVAAEVGVPVSEVKVIAEIAAEHNAAMKPKHTDFTLPIGPGDTKRDLQRKQQEALLSLPHKDLIDLYNTESRRLAGSLDAHTVDATCKPLYIVKLLAKLPVRYQMMAAERSNELAAMSPLDFGESSERMPSESERRREVAPLTKSRPFSII